MRIDPGTGAAVPALSGEEIVSRVHGLRREARLTLEDYARLPGPARHARTGCGGCAQRVADVLRRSRGGRGGAHPRHRHPGGDGVPPRPHPRHRQAGGLLRRHAHGVGAGLGRPGEPDGRGAHRRPSRGAAARRADRGGRGDPRRGGGHQVAHPEPGRVPQPARPAGLPRPRPGACSIGPPFRAPAAAPRGGWCPRWTCTPWPPAWTTRCCARRSPAARAGLVLEATGCGNVPPGGAARGSRPRSPRACPSSSCRAAPRAASPPPTATRAAARCCASMGVIFGQDLPGPKARIKLMVALGISADPAEVRRVFEGDGPA